MNKYLNPKISIIMPVYNVEAYLEECLKSILYQSFKDFEVICVNDGSNDNSLEILENYAKNDNRIIVLNQENQGQGVARNNALNIAKGEFIMFVDPDDYILDNALEILYQYATDNNSKILMFDYQEFKEFNNQINLKEFKSGFKNRFQNKTVYTIKDIKEIGLKKLPKQVWCYFYSRTFIEDYKLRFSKTKIGEDIIFSLGSLLQAKEIHYISKCLYSYRIRKGSAVELVSDMNFEVFTVINEIKSFLKANNLFSYFETDYYALISDLMAVRYGYVPQERLKEYLNESKNQLKNWVDYKKFLFQTKRIYSFNEWLFSIKNRRQNGRNFKQITILGFNFVFKN